ncbi:hypothetical protein [Paraburkholderia flagellata]|uniref:hypothetical protein n=1 Tax=Paraburkholderia flagellata TaxID=2883241 RepID=UPI001F1C779A|nr:hypothetical protein [Paraburkholderia flagellata]
MRHEDFQDCCETSEKGTVGGPYQGKLANVIPFYPDSVGIRVLVQPRPDDLGPLLLTPEGDSSPARHLRDGMPEDLARAYLETVLHPGAPH